MEEPHCIQEVLSQDLLNWMNESMAWGRGGGRGPHNTQKLLTNLREEFQWLRLEGDSDLDG